MRSKRNDQLRLRYLQAKNAYLNELAYQKQVESLHEELSQLMTPEEYQAWAATYDFDSMTWEQTFAIFRLKYDELHAQSVAQTGEKITT